MLLVLYGKTGSGKDHTAKTLESRHHFQQVARPTTRPMRKKEFSKYLFLKEDSFQEMVRDGKIVVPERFRGWSYGFFGDIIMRVNDRENLFVVTCDKASAKNLLYYAKENGGDLESIYFAEVIAPEEDRMIRALKRGAPKDSATAEETMRRIKSDNQDYADIMFIPDFEIGSFGKKKHYLESLDEMVEDILSEGVK